MVPWLVPSLGTKSSMAFLTGNSAPFENVRRTKEHCLHACVYGLSEKTCKDEKHEKRLNRLDVHHRFILIDYRALSQMPARRDCALGHASIISKSKPIYKSASRLKRIAAWPRGKRAEPAEDPGAAAHKPSIGLYKNSRA